MGRVCCALVLTGLLLSLAEADENQQSNKPRQAAAKPQVTISKATTFFTEPLTEAGLVDYTAAINQRLGQGVTPQNNANVLFWQALGPTPGKTVMPEKFFPSMGMAVPPKQGDYYLDLTEYIQQRLRIATNDDAYLKVVGQQGQASYRPWKAAQYPQMVTWIEANEKPLALVVQGTKRPKYFSPLHIPQGEDEAPATMISVLLPAVQKARSFARILSARAMLHAGEGRPAEAWQDLLAVHRLARLVGQGPTLIEGLVGVAINNMAVKSDLAFVEHSRPDARLSRKYLADLAALPPLPDFADKVDLGERCMYLDVTQMLSQEGVTNLSMLTGAQNDNGGVLGKLATSVIDWDTTLRIGNGWYDRLAKIMRIEDRAQRKWELGKVEQDLKKLNEKHRGFLKGASLLLGSNKVRGEAMSDILIALLLPAVARVQQAEDRAVQQDANLRIAIALAGYRTQHGNYPDSLDALTPDLLKQVPLDLFSGKPLNYSRTKDGYLLYSIGPNEKDEGGRYYDDEPRGDDPRVRMPLPPEDDN